MELEIRNVSDSMVCSFTILDFKVYKDNILVESIQEWEIKFKSLKGGEIKNLTVNTSNMSDKMVDIGAMLSSSGNFHVKI